MKRITFDVVKENTTKRFVKYTELTTEYIGSLYISKETFDGKAPDDVLTVTIEDKDRSGNQAASRKGTR